MTMRESSQSRVIESGRPLNLPGTPAASKRSLAKVDILLDGTLISLANVFSRSFSAPQPRPATTQPIVSAADTRAQRFAFSPSSRLASTMPTKVLSSNSKLQFAAPSSKQQPSGLREKTKPSLETRLPQLHPQCNRQRNQTEQGSSRAVACYCSWSVLRFRTYPVKPA